MNYELAKKLRDAGFPDLDVTDLDKRPLRWPSLSRLIDACGTPFMLQTHDGKIWQAFHDTHTITSDENGDGFTPEEAVANLWLELNKKV